jgi:hypothetical protein
VPQIKELPEKETPGTANFMAAELFNGHPGDAISDQFSLGVSVYRLFTVAIPMAKQSPTRARSLARLFPPRIINRTCRPGWRPQS